MAEEKLNTLSQENEKLRVDNELKDRKIELLEQDLNLAKQGVFNVEKLISNMNEAIEKRMESERCHQAAINEFQLAKQDILKKFSELETKNSAHVVENEMLKSEVADLMIELSALRQTSASQHRKFAEKEKHWEQLYAGMVKSAVATETKWTEVVGSTRVALEAARSEGAQMRRQLADTQRTHDAAIARLQKQFERQLITATSQAARAQVEAQQRRSAQTQAQAEETERALRAQIDQLSRRR